MRALLDVNALIALLDAEHVHHAVVVAWLSREDVLPHGFATCAVTQLGCIRVMSGKGYPRPFQPHEVAAKLDALTRQGHCYLDMPPPASGQIHWKSASSVQSTDVALLATAVAHGSRLVTFDAGIAAKGVAGATREHLVVLGAASVA